MRKFSVMRVNLIWYIPLSIAVLFCFVIPDAVSGWQNVWLMLRHFTWALFFSPAAYVFLTCVFASVFAPVQLMLMVPVFFERGSKLYQRRHVASFIVALGAVVACIVLQAVIVGSFPFGVDEAGYVRLRMIPFLPWPGMPASAVLVFVASIVVGAILVVVFLRLATDHAGGSVTQDQGGHLQRMRKAAEQGDAQAQSYMANAYHAGLGVAQNDAEAAKWLRKAAEQGDALAQHNLGVCYNDGIGVAEDDAEAVKWHRKAAEQGNVDALSVLGVCYELGRGVRQSRAAAADCYYKAGLACLAEGDTENALLCHDRLVALDPPDNRYGPAGFLAADLRAKIHTESRPV